MIKEIIISVLASLLVMERSPWFAACGTAAKLGIFAGFYLSFIIFCIFCKKTAKRWRIYRRRMAVYRSRRRR